jgi:hypothetical protein
VEKYTRGIREGNSRIGRGGEVGRRAWRWELRVKVEEKRLGKRDTRQFS